MSSSRLLRIRAGSMHLRFSDCYGRIRPWPPGGLLRHQLEFLAADGAGHHVAFLGLRAELHAELADRAEHLPAGGVPEVRVEEPLGERGSTWPMRAFRERPSPPPRPRRCRRPGGAPTMTSPFRLSLLYTPIWPGSLEASVLGALGVALPDGHQVHPKGLDRQDRHAACTASRATGHVGAGKGALLPGAQPAVDPARCAARRHRRRRRRRAALVARSSSTITPPSCRGHAAALRKSISGYEAEAHAEQVASAGSRRPSVST